eukprot:CAMPEP_0198295540 /NCGR_PEP_ID=MMETSP1449-20131203/28190_1 /TAXON_ID=420275 /ORGANISM="Attheya septentrionalis, Strain CCMP2084" /LENGTH=391 /DNA_ID=CAMNT_0043995885 /DNA_START=121 /DNA_END=1296 /DNA_ORIENTATION=-
MTVGSRDGEMTFEEERERDELEEALALIRAAEEKYPSTMETFEDQTLRLAIELSLADEALKKVHTEVEGEPGASFDEHTGEDDEFAQAVSLQRLAMREQAGAVARRRSTLDSHISANRRSSVIAPDDQRTPFHTTFSAIQLPLEEVDSVVEIDSVDQEKCDLEVSTRHLNARHVVAADNDDDESVVDVDTVGGETCDVEIKTRNMNVRRRSMTHVMPDQEPPELLERLQRLDVSISSRRSSVSARPRTSEERRGTSEVEPSPRSKSRLRWNTQEIEDISSSVSKLREVGQHRREQRALKQAELDEGEGQQSKRNGKKPGRSSSRHSSRRRARRLAEVSGGASAITAPTVIHSESSEDKKLSEGEMEEIVRALMEAGASPAELARVFHSRSA